MTDLKTSAARGLLVALLFTGLTVALTYPHVRSLATGAADVGDPFLNAWTLAWVAHQLPRDPMHLYDANIFHPEPGTLLYSETLIGQSLVAAPVIWLGGSPMLAHNIVFIWPS